MTAKAYECLIVGEVPNTVELTKLQACVEDVVGLDFKYNLTHLHEPELNNLVFMANALAGEVGELCNVVKKIARDGETPERWKHFDEEAVDVMIYLIELLVCGRSKFDSAWDKKHIELHERFAKRPPGGYKLHNRVLIREED